MEHCDVLVVGGGLAGLSCTRELATGGLEVVLVDQKREVGARVHTTGIFVRRTLEDFDLPEECLGPPIREVVLYSPARRSMRLRSRADEFRVGKMAELYRHAWSAAEKAGARLVSGCRFASARPAGAGLEIELAGESGQRRPLTARYLIGADGARSKVAAAMGLGRNTHFLIGVEERLPSARPGQTPVMHCFLDPQLAPGYLAWLVDDGDEAHLGVAGDPERFEPLRALSQFRREVASLLPLADRRLERRGGRIPVGGLLAPIASPRALLVGDAAGAVSPLTAGGLDPCLRQARLAAEVIRAWLSSADPAVLAAYDSPVLRNRFRGRRWMRRLLDGMHGRVATELAFAAMRAGPLSHLAEQVFFGRGSFPDLSLEALLRAGDRSTLLDRGAAFPWLAPSEVDAGDR